MGWRTHRRACASSGRNTFTATSQPCSRSCAIHLGHAAGADHVLDAVAIRERRAESVEDGEHPRNCRVRRWTIKEEYWRLAATTHECEPTHIFLGMPTFITLSRSRPMSLRIPRALVAIVALGALATAAAAQQPTRTDSAAARPALPRRTPTPNDSLVSPEVAADGQVTFRVYAPKATEVAVSGEAVPGLGRPLAMTRDARGVWSAVSPPLSAGAYRYTFVIDGVATLDPKNLSTSATQTALNSLVVVSRGDDFQANRPEVPHGAVANVLYHSPTLGERRMHVYTPPGYNRGSNFPVLYLIHGGGDADESWSTVGRAGFILDNLIASGKARPMVVVMPAGGVGRQSAPMTSDATKDPFTRDLLDVVIPYVQANYRVSARPEDRALAGLSMGGIQTLNIGLTNLEKFRWLGVFSSGWFPADLQSFEEHHGRALETTRTPPKLFWMAHGATDIAKPQSEKVIAMLGRHGIKVASRETPGGHTWSNWRDYLRDFAPLLFR